VPGRANRLVARHADVIRTSVPLVSDAALGGPPEVGFPIRRAAQAAMDPLSCRERLGLDPALSTLLVTGASQGASSLDALMELILAEDPLALSGWQVIHLSGQADEEALRAAYREADVPAQIFPFLRQMGLAWGAADLALSRAGANSVAEAAANHVPTLFVPYPYHRDLHQRYNAEPLVASGAAEMAMDAIDGRANRSAIGDPLIALLTDPARRNSMRANLESRQLADGATEIATLLLEQG
jgi:UDP-N-acetylglucosamine--N-acetylmuramyl-(pentapeptide) pyrophosphoryl-undecaprenol N-acetylglucosamine transferase